MKMFIRLFIVFFLFSFGVNAQKKKSKDEAPVVIPDMPIDVDTKRITYSDVISIDTTEKKVLFNRALSWANNYYVNPKDVIRSKDLNEGSLVLKARYRIYTTPDEDGTKVLSGDVMYTMTIDVKDNKYRYSITDFNWQKRSAFPIERWMDQESDTFQPVYAAYLEQTDELMKEIITSFTTRMATVENVKDDDW